MEIKIIKRKKHYLFNSYEEYSNIYNNEIKNNWRDGEEGDWVYTDDNFICQILKRSKLSHPSYKELRNVVRTVCGSYIIEQKSRQMLGKNGVAQNIYAFSGNYKSIYDRQNSRKLKSREFLFASFVSSGQDVRQSFKKAFPRAKNDRYITEKTNALLNKKRIREMIKKAVNKFPSQVTDSAQKIKKRCHKYVYFIKCNNAIKVGISESPKKRIKNLQTANPNKLEMIGYVYGDILKEQEIHMDLQKYRLNGEWFKCCVEVEKYINKIIKRKTEQIKLF